MGRFYPELVAYIRRERRTRSLRQIRAALLADGERIAVSTIRRLSLGVPQQARNPGRRGHSPELRTEKPDTARGVPRRTALITSELRVGCPAPS